MSAILPSACVDAGVTPDTLDILCKISSFDFQSILKQRFLAMEDCVNKVQNVWELEI